MSAEHQGSPPRARRVHRAAVYDLCGRKLPVPGDDLCGPLIRAAREAER